MVALLLWVTDWLHGVSPGWVALGAALVCTLPGIGVTGLHACEAATSSEPSSMSRVYSAWLA